MSIQTELTRLTNAKAAIQTAIEGKGVTVPSDTLLDGMAALIDAIEAGGGVSYDTITFSKDYSNPKDIRTDLVSISDNTAKIIMFVNESIFNNESYVANALGVFLWYPGGTSGYDIQGTRGRSGYSWFSTWAGTASINITVHAGDTFRRYTFYGN